jgi:hypothetical protein
VNERSLDPERRGKWPYVPGLAEAGVLHSPGLAQISVQVTKQHGPELFCIPWAMHTHTQGTKQTERDARVQGPGRAGRESAATRDGNGYPKPDGFYPIRVRVWVKFRTHGFINGHKYIPDGFMGTGLFLEYPNP